MPGSVIGLCSPGEGSQTENWDKSGYINSWCAKGNQLLRCFVDAAASAVAHIFHLVCVRFFVNPTGDAGRKGDGLLNMNYRGRVDRTEMTACEIGEFIFFLSQAIVR